MKKVILLFFLLIFTSGCDASSPEKTNINKIIATKNQEINEKLKSGDLICETAQDCIKFGYTCYAEGDKPVCMIKDDWNFITNGHTYEDSVCRCFNPNLDY